MRLNSPEQQLTATYLEVPRSATSRRQRRRTLKGAIVHATKEPPRKPRCDKWEFANLAVSTSISIILRHVLAIATTVPGATPLFDDQIRSGLAHPVFVNYCRCPETRPKAKTSVHVCACEGRSYLVSDVVVYMHVYTKGLQSAISPMDLRYVSCATCTK